MSAAAISAALSYGSYNLRASFDKAKSRLGGEKPPHYVDRTRQMLTEWLSMCVFGIAYHL